MDPIESIVPNTAVRKTCIHRHHRRKLHGWAGIKYAIVLLDIVPVSHSGVGALGYRYRTIADMVFILSRVGYL